MAVLHIKNSKYTEKVMTQPYIACQCTAAQLRFCTLIFAVLLAIFAHFLIFQYFHLRWKRLFSSKIKILCLPERQLMVSLYGVRQNGGHIEHMFSRRAKY